MDRRAPRSRIGRAVALALVPALSAGLAYAEDPIFLSDAGSGVFEVEGETTLRVSDMIGSVLVRPGRFEDVRFMAVSPESDDEEIPVGFWKDGSTLWIAPLDPESAVPVRLEVVVPESFDLDFALFGAELVAGGVSGSVSFEGSDSDVRFHGLGGDLDIDAEGGRIEVVQTSGPIVVSTKRSDVSLHRITGELDLSMREGRLELVEILAPVEADLDEVAATGDELGRGIVVEARGGSLRLERLDGEANLRLDGTPLELVAVSGDVSIETDAEVRFRECKAAFHIDSYGGSLKGAGNQGLLEIKTEQAEIVLERIDGPVRIQGDGLEISLKEIGGELDVYVTRSEVTAETMAAPIRITNEFGDITLADAAKQIDVSSRDGDVTIDAAKGPVSLMADGPNVSVAWNSLRWSGESTITNAGGDVTVRFPSDGGGRVEAEAGLGSVESELPAIAVVDNGNRATGLLNRKGEPRIRIEAAGGLRLLPGGGEDAVAAE